MGHPVIYRTQCGHSESSRAVTLTDTHNIYSDYYYEYYEYRLTYEYDYYCSVLQYERHRVWRAVVFLVRGQKAIVLDMDLFNANFPCVAACFALLEYYLFFGRASCV